MRRVKRRCFGIFAVLGLACFAMIWLLAFYALATWRNTRVAVRSPGCLR